jgi:ABC-type amino acid transport substrate-binding protein
MKAEVEIVISGWGGLISRLLAKKFDFVVLSLSIAGKRKQVVDFAECRGRYVREG